MLDTYDSCGLMREREPTKGHHHDHKQKSATAGPKLRTAYVARRTSYTQLGRAAASELDGTEKQKQRLAGLLAAIPIVEIVVARTRDIVQQCLRVPEYTEPAGHGFALVSKHEPVKAGLFLTALNEIEGTRRIYARDHARWQQRLAQLSLVERGAIGSRPGGER